MGYELKNRIYTPSQEEERAYRDWIASRPEKVKIVAERFEPWSLYRMRSTGHRVTVYSIDEKADGEITLTVTVSGDYNLISFERNVFGVNPDDLEPCELPLPNERVGAFIRLDDI